MKEGINYSAQVVQVIDKSQIWESKITQKEQQLERRGSVPEAQWRMPSDKTRNHSDVGRRELEPWGWWGRG